MSWERLSTRQTIGCLVLGVLPLICLVIGLSFYWLACP